MKQQLPESITLRSATLEDRDCIASLWNARSKWIRNTQPHREDDVRRQWDGPSFCVATDTLLVLDGTEALIGYAHIRDVKNPPVDVFCGCCVHPDFDEQPWLWSTLLDWIESEARRVIPRAPADARVVLVAGASDDDPSRVRQLAGYGFDHSRTFWRMVIDFAETSGSADFPKGISVRNFVPGQDDETLVHAHRDAFRHHYGHLEEPFETDLAMWRRWMQDDDFHPELWFLATDGATNDIVGFCCCYPSGGGVRRGLIDELGVRHGWRRRGIARALLVHAFGALQSIGLEGATLRVDSKNPQGAVRLYEAAGFRVQDCSHTYVKELRAGRNLVAE